MLQQSAVNNINTLLRPCRLSGWPVMCVTVITGWGVAGWEWGVVDGQVGVRGGFGVGGF